jgi:hypothetical protein
MKDRQGYCGRIFSVFFPTTHPSGSNGMEGYQAGLAERLVLRSDGCTSCDRCALVCRLPRKNNAAGLFSKDTCKRPFFGLEHLSSSSSMIWRIKYPLHSILLGERTRLGTVATSVFEVLKMPRYRSCFIIHARYKGRRDSETTKV